MKRGSALDAFQEILDRVARNGLPEEVDQDLVPEVRAWDHLDGKGCTISVERGHWWVVPPGGGTSERPAA